MGTETEMEKTAPPMIAEVVKQARLAGPLISANLLMSLLQLISIMIVGKLGNLALSGAAMAISFATVTGFSVLMGMGCALESLCGQAFGAKQYKMLGVQLQKAMLVLTASSIPIAFLWFFSERIFIFLHQDPEISKKAGLYARWMLPCLFAYGLVQCQIRFLQAQNIVMPLMLSAGAAALFHIFTSWVLVYKSGLGYVGAALSASFSYWLIVLLLGLYIGFSPACKGTWNGLSKDALRDIIIFIKLAIPSAVMICLEYWSFEAIVIFSGLLQDPKKETSTMSICLNTCTTFYMITFGTGAAISTRVSNELGAGDSHAVKLVIRVAVIIGTVEGLLLGTTIMLMRNIWGRAFSHEEEVISYVASLMPFIAAVIFIDLYQCVVSGIVRGCGWQIICTYVNLGSYYVIGIPISAVLAFNLHMNGKGLWTGIICALLAQVLILGTISIRNNWENEALKAIERVQSLAPAGNVQNQNLPQHLKSNELWSIELESGETTRK